MRPARPSFPFFRPAPPPIFCISWRLFPKIAFFQSYISSLFPKKWHFSSEKQDFLRPSRIFNSAAAANCLGLLLFAGKESWEWFQKAADLGLKVAYYNLAYQELSGYSKTYDIEKAKKWLEIAGEDYSGHQQHIRLLMCTQ